MCIDVETLYLPAETPASSVLLLFSDGVVAATVLQSECVLHGAEMDMCIGCMVYRERNSHCFTESA